MKQTLIKFSNRPLTDDETSLLAKGGNFSITPQTIPTEEGITNIEAEIEILPPGVKEEVCSESARIPRKPKLPKSNILRGEKEAIRSLNENEKIIILPFDKGNATVVMNTSDYRRNLVVCSKTTDLGFVESNKRGMKKPPNKMESSKKKTVITHIRRFPKYASHYSRKEFWNERQEEPVKESYYRFVFNTEFNVKFHKPYSDTCSRCDNFHNIIKHSKDLVLVNNTKRDLELHQRKAKKTNDAKKSDTEANKNSEDTVVICFDLQQQTLLTPLLSTSKVFYIHQL
ncbi:unnamed protein product [Psylliodes chrysocephalus]|uniref:Uncharacterized protein n=1 Tax=Psylliodes chrysocephalus TaxID=3402493 RepID=A0A9P0G5G1_9CUCU|nr:unnamed protein product [Psylliodes chrysocephala]